MPRFLRREVFATLICAMTLSAASLTANVDLDALEKAYEALGGALACSGEVIHLRESAREDARIVGTLEPETPTIALDWTTHTTGSTMGAFAYLEEPHTNASGWVLAHQLQPCAPSNPDLRSPESYRRDAAVAYAYKWVFSANHRCGRHDACSPYSYWGWESCGYSSHGGDCANFVSQCLVEAGHPLLRGGLPCRGYPCGKEEVGAKNLGDCLVQKFRWKRTCGNRQAPPAGVKPGDVLIYHAGSCSSYNAHSTIVTRVDSATNVYVTGHSSNAKDAHYDYLRASKPFYEWLQLA